MKTINVSGLVFPGPFPDLDNISKKLDNLVPRNVIGEANWKEFPYRPSVEFSIAYTGNEILLKYYVTEESFKVEKTESNDPVYEDSCVEFFFSPSDDGIYYNFEFNGIGTCLAGYGTGRKGRISIDPAVISRIRRISSAGNSPIAVRTEEYSWDLTIAIPFSLFIGHNIGSLQGKTFRANFYKCGDKTGIPHYLSWSPVETSIPDYHRPEYFGFLNFI